MLRDRKTQKSSAWRSDHGSEEVFVVWGGLRETGYIIGIIGIILSRGDSPRWALEYFRLQACDWLSKTEVD